MFNTGFVIFTLGSLFCGLLPTIKWLIASRIIQALGGAFMQANSGAIVADTFPPKKGINSALSVSIIIIAIAGIMSWMRGTEKRGEKVSK